MSYQPNEIGYLAVRVGVGVIIFIVLSIAFADSSGRSCQARNSVEKCIRQSE